MHRRPALRAPFRWILLLLAVVAPTIAQGQGGTPPTPPAIAPGAPGTSTPTPGLTVRRSDGTNVVLTPAQIAALPHTTVSAANRGTPSQFSGVPLAALLTAASVGPVDSVTGLRLRLVVLVTGSDGYRVAFSLAELDRTIGRRQVLVADKVDGQPPKPEDGPFRLVVPDDARPSRWVRNITRIDVIYPP